MTLDDIAEMFIRAAETEAKLPRPKGTTQQYGRYALPWVHTHADIVDRRRTNMPGESLEAGDNPLEDWRFEWIRNWARRPTTAEITDWEACLSITTDFISDVGQRRALWAWAFAKAAEKLAEGTETKGRPRRKSFAAWCRSEGIAEITGHRRKNRALNVVLMGYCGKGDLHDTSAQNRVLPDARQKRHVSITVEGGVTVFDTTRSYKASTWADDPSFRLVAFSIAEMRSLRRRQQEAAKRKMKAAA